MPRKLYCFCKIILVIFLTFGLNTVLFAEFYVVYETPAICIYCSKTVVKKHKVRVSHKRHHCAKTKYVRRSTYRVEVSYPRPNLSCCGYRWMNNCSGCGGEWVPIQPAETREFVSYAPSPIGMEYVIPSEEYYFSDMATADDNAYRYPDLQVTW